MKRMFTKRPVTCARDTQVSQEDVRELVLYITNDADLYHQIATPIINNMKRKRKSGKYDDTLAVKGWMHLADAGVKKYDKEFGSGRGSLTMLNKATREAIARELKEEYEDEISFESTEASTSTKGDQSVSAASVTTSNSFDNFEPWSGAVSTWRILEEYDRLSDLEDFIDSEYYDEEAGEGVIDETQLNDLLWHEPEFVYEIVGLYYNPETDEVSDEPFDDDDYEEGDE